MGKYTQLLGQEEQQPVPPGGGGGKYSKMLAEVERPGPSREAIFPAAERPKPAPPPTAMQRVDETAQMLREKAGPGYELGTKALNVFTAGLAPDPAATVAGAYHAIAGSDPESPIESRAAGVNKLVHEALPAVLTAVGGPILGGGRAALAQGGRAALTKYAGRQAAELGGGAALGLGAEYGLREAGMGEETAELLGNVVPGPLALVSTARRGLRYMRGEGVPPPPVTPAPTVVEQSGTAPIPHDERRVILDDLFERFSKTKDPVESARLAKEIESLERVTGQLDQQRDLPFEPIADPDTDYSVRLPDISPRPEQPALFEGAPEAPDMSVSNTTGDRISQAAARSQIADLQASLKDPALPWRERMDIEDAIEDLSAQLLPEGAKLPPSTTAQPSEVRTMREGMRGEIGELRAEAENQLANTRKALKMQQGRMMKAVRALDPDQTDEMTLDFGPIDTSRTQLTPSDVRLTERQPGDIVPEAIGAEDILYEYGPAGGPPDVQASPDVTITGSVPTQRELPLFLDEPMAASVTGDKKIAGIQSAIDTLEARLAKATDPNEVSAIEAAARKLAERVRELEQPVPATQQHTGSGTVYDETFLPEKPTWRVQGEGLPEGGADLRAWADLAKKVDSPSVEGIAVARQMSEAAAELRTRAAKESNPVRRRAMEMDAAAAEEAAKAMGVEAKAQFVRDNADLLRAKQKMAAKAAESASGRPNVTAAPGATGQTAADIIDTPLMDVHRENPWATGINFFRSVESRLTNVGDPGAKLAGKYRNVFTEGKREAGKSIEPLLKDGLEKMDNVERINLGHVLAGTAAPVSDRVAITAAEARAQLNEVGRRAVAQGVEIRPDGSDAKVRSQLAEQDPELFQMLEDYVPRMVYNPEAYLSAPGSIERAAYPGSVTRGKKSAAQEIQKEGSGKIGRAVRWSPVAKDVMDNLVEQGIVPDQLTAERVMSQFVRAQTEQVQNAPRELADLHAVLAKFNPSLSAEQMAAKLRQRTRLTDPMMGSLEKHRTLDLSPLADPNMARVLPKYFENAHQRLAEIKHLGQRLQEVENVISEAAKAGAPPPAIDHLIRMSNVVLGGVPPAEHSNLVAAMTKAQLMKLGLAAIPNMLQTINALWYTGDVWSYMRAVYDVYLKGMAHAAGAPVDFEANKIARQSGATIESAVRKLTSADSQHGRILDGTLWLFTKTEDANRMISAMTGFRWADKLEAGLRKGGKDAEWAARELDLMGLDSARIRTQNHQLQIMTHDDKLDIAQRVNDITNFSSNPLDTPAFLHGESSQFARMVWQFKTYAYGMGRMASQRMMHDIKNNPARAAADLAALAAFYPVAGYAASQARATIYDAVTGGDTEKDKVAERYGLAENDIDLVKFIYAGLGETAVLGLLNSAIESSQYRGMPDFLVGPSISSGARVVEAGVSENPTYELLKWGVKGYAPFGAAIWRAMEPAAKDTLDYQTASDKEKRAKARSAYQ